MASTTEAILWIHGKTCRVLLKEDGIIVDKNDMWNNRASAEDMVRTSVPEATIRYITAASEMVKLNEEWLTPINPSQHVLQVLNHLKTTAVPKEYLEQVDNYVDIGMFTLTYCLERHPFGSNYVLGISRRDKNVFVLKDVLAELPEIEMVWGEPLSVFAIVYANRGFTLLLSYRD